MILLIDEIVDSKNLMKQVVIQTPQYSTNNADHKNRRKSHPFILHTNIADIKQDEPSSSEKPTFPRIAVLHKPSQHHNHDCGAKESPPQKSTPPPCGNLFEGEKNSSHWWSESSTDTGGCTAGNEIPAVPVILEVAKPSPVEMVLVSSALGQKGWETGTNVD